MSPPRESAVLPSTTGPCSSMLESSQTQTADRPLNMPRLATKELLPPTLVDELHLHAHVSHTSQRAKLPQADLLPPVNEHSISGTSSAAARAVTSSASSGTTSRTTPSLAVTLRLPTDSSSPVPAPPPPPPPPPPPLPSREEISTWIELVFPTALHIFVYDGHLHIPLSAVLPSLAKLRSSTIGAASTSHSSSLKPPLPFLADIVNQTLTLRARAQISSDPNLDTSDPEDNENTREAKARRRHQTAIKSAVAQGGSLKPLDNVCDASGQLLTPHRRSQLAKQPDPVPNFRAGLRRRGPIPSFDLPKEGDDPFLAGNEKCGQRQESRSLVYRSPRRLIQERKLDEQGGMATIGVQLGRGLRLRLPPTVVDQSDSEVEDEVVARMLFPSSIPRYRPTGGPPDADWRHDIDNRRNSLRRTGTSTAAGGTTSTRSLLADGSDVTMTPPRPQWTQRHTFSPRREALKRKEAERNPDTMNYRSQLRPKNATSSPGGEGAKGGWDGAFGGSAAARTVLPPRWPTKVAGDGCQPSHEAHSTSTLRASRPPTLPTGHDRCPDGPAPNAHHMRNQAANNASKLPCTPPRQTSPTLSISSIQNVSDFEPSVTPTPTPQVPSITNVRVGKIPLKGKAPLSTPTPTRQRRPSTPRPDTPTPYSSLSSALLTQSQLPREPLTMEGTALPKNPPPAGTFSRSATLPSRNSTVRESRWRR